MDSHTERIQTKMLGEGKCICLGLDPKPGLVLTTDAANIRDPTEYIERFCAEIVEATHDLVAAYKPNPAFFMAYGSKGVRALEGLVHKIQEIAPDVPIIFDQMAGDTENTNKMYAQMFDHYKIDAMTVQYYMGRKTLEPFISYGNGSKGIYVMARSSNRGSGGLQDLLLHDTGRHVYQEVAWQVKEMSKASGNCGLVVGATFPYDIRTVRDTTGDMPLPYLVPGLITQGGEVKEVLTAGKDSRGGGLLFAVSRSILYAFGPETTQPERSRRKLLELIQEIKTASEFIDG